MYVKGIIRISPLQILSLSLSLSLPSLYPHRHTCTYMHMYTKSMYIHTRTSPTINSEHSTQFSYYGRRQTTLCLTVILTSEGHLLLYYTIHRHLERSWTKLVISESYIPKCSGKFFSHKMITNHQTKLVTPRGNVISCIVLSLTFKKVHISKFEI